MTIETEYRGSRSRTIRGQTLQIGDFVLECEVIKLCTFCGGGDDLVIYVPASHGNVETYCCTNPGECIKNQIARHKLTHDLKMLEGKP